MYISKTIMSSAFLPGILDESDCEEFHCHLQNKRQMNTLLLLSIPNFADDKKIIGFEKTTSVI